MTAVTRATSFDSVCFYGTATGLEAELTSYVIGGDDCTATYGCGVHVHSGTSCAAGEQGIPFYDSNKYMVDPWLESGYLSTDTNGNAQFVVCVSSGETDLLGRALILHSNDGTASSCGTLVAIDAPIPDNDDITDEPGDGNPGDGNPGNNVPDTVAPTPLTPFPTSTPYPTDSPTSYPTGPTVAPIESDAPSWLRGMRVLSTCLLVAIGFIF